MELEENILNLMNDIKYGWFDKNKVKHLTISNEFSKNYILQTPQEVIENKVGVCWDQVELERYYFKKNKFKFKTYFLIYYDNNKCPTHTFLVYEKNSKYYWFEHSWEIFKGIHEYVTLKELLLDVRNKFIKYELNNNFDESSLLLREYDEPQYHISVQDFFAHCEKEKIIVIDNI